MERKLNLLALDYGSVTVGVAGSDGLFLTAQPIETIRRKRESHLRDTFRRIEELIVEREVNCLVVGYPLKLNDTVGERALASEAFADDLTRRTGLKTVLWDERYTTVAAHQILDEAEMGYRRKAEVVDKLAAVFILESFMEHLGNHPEEKERLLEEIYGRV